MKKLPKPIGTINSDIINQVAADNGYVIITIININ